jgi:hypothetical protein
LYVLHEVVVEVGVDAIIEGEEVAKEGTGVAEESGGEYVVDENDADVEFEFEFGFEFGFEVEVEVKVELTVTGELIFEFGAKFRC